MQALSSRQMTIVADHEHSSVTEVIKLPVKPENLQRMMNYVQDWHEMVIPTLPGFQNAALLSSAAGAVFVYANWSSNEAIEQDAPVFYAWGGMARSFLYMFQQKILLDIELYISSTDVTYYLMSPITGCVTYYKVGIEHFHTLFWATDSTR